MEVGMRWIWESYFRKRRETPAPNPLSFFAGAVVKYFFENESALGWERVFCSKNFGPWELRLGDRVQIRSHEITPNDHEENRDRDNL
jgi:hypothetical protein